MFDDVISGVQKTLTTQKFGIIEGKLLKNVNTIACLGPAFRKPDETKPFCVSLYKMLRNVLYEGSAVDYCGIYTFDKTALESEKYKNVTDLPIAISYRPNAIFYC